MTKITIIGAGSTVFMRNIVTDILLEPIFSQCHIALQDIDEKRLKTSQLVVKKITDKLGVSPEVTATTSREEALTGANFVILMIQVGHKDKEV